MNPSDEQTGTQEPLAGGASQAAPSSTSVEVTGFSRRPGGAGKKPPPPPTSGGGGGDDDDDEGMLRMSFLEHLEELRSRIIKALGGIAVAFVLSLAFTKPLWNFIKAPASAALKSLGYPEKLVAIDPMEQFNVIWFKLPVVCAIFMASPWVFYPVSYTHLTLPTNREV